MKAALSRLRAAAAGRAIPAGEFRPQDEARGMMLAYFGKGEKPSDVLVVNLDYNAEASATMIGPGTPQIFDVATGKWSSAESPRITLALPPGGGTFVCVRQ